MESVVDDIHLTTNILQTGNSTSIVDHFNVLTALQVYDSSPSTVHVLYKSESRHLLNVMPRSRDGPCEAPYSWRWTHHLQLQFVAWERNLLPCQQEACWDTQRNHEDVSTGHTQDGAHRGMHRAFPPTGRGFGHTLLHGESREEVLGATSPSGSSQSTSNASQWWHSWRLVEIGWCVQLHSQVGSV